MVVTTIKNIYLLENSFLVAFTNVTGFAEHYFMKNNLSSINQFVGIEAHIFGEESNEFTNTLGETVQIGVQANEEDTAQLLGLFFLV